MSVRVRFAPSPTGSLHVGGVRTAVYSWLLAKQTGGSFMIRIEDTDRERLVPGAVQEILEDFAWLGIFPDEGPSLQDLERGGYSWPEAKGIGGSFGPYVQSLRLAQYQAVAERLVEMGAAYRCDCSSERLEEERQAQIAAKVPPGYSGYCRNRNVPKNSKHVIRLRIPSDLKLTLNDLIKGDVVWEQPALRDTVLQKSDGYPTYHLAVVVDDHEMEITHVLRGEEWIPTTPIHLLLYQLLGWTPPAFAHTPSVLGQDGKKLSKRHGATTIKSFREPGYLPEALVNFLVLIGWSPGDGEEQEIFSREELIKRFSLEKVNRAAGIFSLDKLNWMNGMYLRALSPEDLATRIRPYLIDAGYQVDDELLLKITPHIQERMNLLPEAVSLVDFLFVDKIDHDKKLFSQKGIDQTGATQILKDIRETLAGLNDFSAAVVEQAIRLKAETLPFPSGAVFMLTRIAVTGKKVTPPLFESVAILGKDKSLARIDSALEKLSIE